MHLPLQREDKFHIKDKISGQVCTSSTERCFFSVAFFIQECPLSEVLQYLRDGAAEETEAASDEDGGGGQ